MSSRRCWAKSIARPPTSVWRAAAATAGQYNTTIGVYIGGGDTQADSQVQVNLSGAANQVDSHGLGISTDTIDTSAHALTAISDITTAVTNLGATQGAVGTGENDLHVRHRLGQLADHQ